MLACDTLNRKTSPPRFLTQTTGRHGAVGVGQRGCNIEPQRRVGPNPV
jgi:hypothetical protein